jgi:hypothetical protein
MRRLADTLIIVGTALAILILLTGGGGIAIWNLRLSARNAVRPMALATVGAVVAVYLARRAHKTVAIEHVVRLGLATLVAVGVGLALSWQVQACGGLDSYGYVSAASLIASGTLKQHDSLGALLPSDWGLRALAPLAYVVTPDHTAFVPRFPLGFPLLMAPFAAVARDSVFVVPLLCALVAIAIAYRFARERAGAIAGWLAAALVVTDPVFFNQAIQPMSDVPASMWLLASFWLAVRDRPMPFLSGAAAGMALLTRPALFVAVAALGAALLLLSPRRVAPFAASVALFIIAQAALQHLLYGSWLTSGYGSNEHLFQLSRFPANVFNYAKWMFIVYAPVGLITIAAAGVMWRRVRASAWAWTAALVFAGVLAPYLLYVIFDDWEVTRFLLPGTVLLMVVGACFVWEALQSRLGARWTPIAVVILAVAIGARSYVFLVRHDVQKLAQTEAKYPIIGDWIQQHTPADAVMVSSLYSGSLRYYADRRSLRWDEIPPGHLTEAVSILNGTGRICYLVLDGPEEEALFRARFGDELAKMTFLPAGRVHGRNIVTIVAH